MSKEMFINAVDNEECRIAVLEDRELQELYIERASAEHHVGNIYKGRVTNVEPSIQAAFVDYGQPKNGFLHVSDVSSSYFPSTIKSHGPQKPPIQNILKRGQEVIVQVTKEGIGTKGPTMTTYLSIAGRYLVLMPGLNRVGVSRKIEDEDQRRKLREALEGLDRPKNLGVIIRTAGLDQPKRELQRDLNYLDRLWKMVQERIKASKAPAEIFRESDLVARTIRDIFTTDIENIWVDDADVAKRAGDFLRIAMPRYAGRVRLYEEKAPLFHRYGLEEEIEKVYSRSVPLPSGGYLVIDQAEALVAIDVNSGKFRTEKNAEEAAFKLNMEAGKEIVRQLRLRDLGGVIVMDFVDMRSEKHKRAVEDLLRKELKKDRARSKFLRTSKFGLIEMTRQRMRASIERSTFMECPHCRGTGLLKTPESMSLDVMRQLSLAVSQDDVQQIEVTVHPAVAHYIHNRKRKALVRLEERSGKHVMVMTDPTVGQEVANFHCQDGRGIPVKFDPREAARQQQARAAQRREEAAREDARREAADEADETAETQEEKPAASAEKPQEGKRDSRARSSRRRSRGRDRKSGETKPAEKAAEKSEEKPAAAAQPAAAADAAPQAAEAPSTAAADDTASQAEAKPQGEGGTAKPKRRRGRRGGRRHKKPTGNAPKSDSAGGAAQ